ncbi:MAG: hypothetical protein HY647_12960 [Acidobacteria bacterium]|nr:hypothetical protein [Acidobacteriota bacterium]
MSEEEIIQTEQRLLRLICQGGISREHQEKLLSLLRCYVFHQPQHQVLFDCLWAMPQHRPELARSLLPTRLVQAGFPDFDLSPYWEPHGLTLAEARELCARLLQTAMPKPTPPQRRVSTRQARWILPALIVGVLVAGVALFPTGAGRQAEESLAQVATEHYRFFYRPQDYGVKDVEAFAQQRERAFQGMAKRLGWEPPSGEIQFFLFSTYEQKASQDYGRGEFFADPVQSTVAAVWNEAVSHVELLPDAWVWTEQAWGKPAHPFLGLAVAVYAADAWRGQPLESWGPRITYEEGPYSLDLLANADVGDGRQGEFLSPLVQRPLAGEFARWVVSRWGMDELRKLYDEAESPLPESLAALLGSKPQALEAAWKQWLLDQARNYAPQPNSRLPHQPFFQRGVAFTQERWRDGGDYASTHIEEALKPLKPLGVDAVTIHPFAFMPGLHVPELIRFSGESDEGINNTTVQAHRLGLKVMLKPQIWLRGGRFAGDVHFDDPRERALWFARYRRWILHYARLAEQNGSELFCIGNELRRMAQYDSYWRELIAAVRRIYSGPITYAAHWGEEFETLKFWDALDYMGLNNYYPLTPIENTAAATLQQGAEELARRVEQVQRRWRRPVLFTEVGFPSVRGGVRQPWNERVSSEVDLAEQARAYEAIFRAFYGQPWFYGMYWWKWYSTGSGGGPNDGMLTPMNKPAAEVMARWYLGPTRRSLERSNGNPR